MARDHGDGDPIEASSHASQECMPCRGTGQVISNLGGSASKIECPWCGGDGMRHIEVDAQARWGAAQDAPGSAGEGEAAEAA